MKVLSIIFLIIQSSGVLGAFTGETDKKPQAGIPQSAGEESRVAEETAVESSDLTRADAYFATQRYKIARGFYLAALQGERGHGHIHTQLGKIAALSGETRLAEEHFQAALKSTRSTNTGLFREIHYNLAKGAFQRGEFNQAYTHIKKAQLISPDDKDSTILLTTLSVKLGKYPHAIKILEQALLRAPEDIEYQEQLADTYTKIRKEDKAKELYQKILAQDPTHKNAHYKISKLFLKSGDFKKAEFHATQLTAIYPQSRKYKYYRGLIHIKSKRYKQATRTFEEISRRFPEDKPTHKALGELYFKQGQYAQSIEQYEALLTGESIRNPETGKTLERIADAQFKLQDYTNALLHYHAALLTQSHKQSLKEKLGQTQIKKRHIHAAIETYLGLLRQDRTKPRYFQRLGECYILNKDRSAALKLFRHILSKFPKYEQIETIKGYLKDSKKIS